MVTKKTYTEIAKSTGLSVSHVSRVLRKKKKPSIKVLALLAWELDSSIEKLMRKLSLTKNNLRKGWTE